MQRYAVGELQVSAVVRMAMTKEVADMRLEVCYLRRQFRKLARNKFRLDAGILTTFDLLQQRFRSYQRGHCLKHALGLAQR